MPGLVTLTTALAALVVCLVGIYAKSKPWLYVQVGMILLVLATGVAGFYYSKQILDTVIVNVDMAEREELYRSAIALAYSSIEIALYSLVLLAPLLLVNFLTRNAGTR